jgi:hypothetical protein
MFFGVSISFKIDRLLTALTLLSMEVPFPSALEVVYQLVKEELGLLGVHPHDLRGGRVELLAGEADLAEMVRRGGNRAPLESFDPPPEVLILRLVVIWRIRQLQLPHFSCSSALVNCMSFDPDQDSHE